MHPAGLGGGKHRWYTFAEFFGDGEGCELTGGFYQEAGPIEKIAPPASGIHIIPIVSIPADFRSFYSNLLGVLPIPPILTPAFAGQASESRKC